MTTKPELPANLGPVEWIGPDDEAYQKSGLIHIVRLPEGAANEAPVPVAVLVHGWGGDERVMWIFSRTIPKEAAIITPRAPLTIEDGQYRWFDNQETPTGPTSEGLLAGVNKLADFLTSLPQLYPVDPKRLLLIGFSQGGAVCNQLVLQRPGLSCGLASLASWIPEPPDLKPAVDSLNGFPVFIAHGVDDERIPVSGAQRTREIYTELGAEVTYEEYPVGHKMNAQAMRDLQAWAAKTLKIND
jgi:phospholipase/carboxylesterase